MTAPDPLPVRTGDHGLVWVSLPRPGNIRSEGACRVVADDGPYVKVSHYGTRYRVTRDRILEPLVCEDDCQHGHITDPDAKEA